LYIATGNIGVNEHSQSLQSTWGKILRLKADGSIPSDNPFYSTAEGMRIFAISTACRNLAPPTSGADLH